MINALNWLKQNNELYENVLLDYETAKRINNQFNIECSKHNEKGEYLGNEIVSAEKSLGSQGPVDEKALI